MLSLVNSKRNTSLPENNDQSTNS